MYVLTGYEDAAHEHGTCVCVSRVYGAGHADGARVGGDRRATEEPRACGTSVRDPRQNSGGHARSTDKHRWAQTPPSEKPFTPPSTSHHQHAEIARGARGDHLSQKMLVPLALATSVFSYTPGLAPAPRLSRAACTRMAAGEEAPLAMSELDQYNSRRQFLRTSAAAAMAAALTTASPTYAKGPKNSVYFTNVKDGDTVPSTFTYKFEVTGYELSPAKDGLKEGTGHHHMIIDGPGSFVDPGEVIPMDATHKHYGKAQTEGELELEPGKHKITLQFANAYHESYGRPSRVRI